MLFWHALVKILLCFFMSTVHVSVTEWVDRTRAKSLLQSIHYSYIKRDTFCLSRLLDIIKPSILAISLIGLRRLLEVSIQLLNVSFIFSIGLTGISFELLANPRHIVSWLGTKTDFLGWTTNPNLSSIVIMSSISVRHWLPQWMNRQNCLWHHDPSYVGKHIEVL